MPNLFQRVVRSISGVQSPRPWLINLLGGTATSAGETVSNINAPKVATVYACVSLISNTIASLPFRLYRETDAGNILLPGLIDDMVRKQPNKYYNSYDFRKAMMTNLLLRGNAYILPMRDGASLAGIELIDNDYVTIDTTSGDLIYQLRLNNGINMRLLPEQIIHLKLWPLTESMA